MHVRSVSNELLPPSQFIGLRTSLGYQFDQRVFCEKIYIFLREKSRSGETTREKIGKNLLRPVAVSYKTGYTIKLQILKRLY
jgi:hypothetical protein